MKIISILVLSLLLFSCHNKNEVSSNVSSNGFWQQLGYGKVIQIENDSVTIFDICHVGCNLHEKDLLSEMGKIDSFSRDSLTIRKNLKTYRFVRLDKLPVLSSQSDTNSNNPIYNFEVLWNTFNEHYSYFETRSIDWNSMYKIYRPKITIETTDLELYQIFVEMLSSINDGHVNMDVPDELVEEIREIGSEKEVTSSTQENQISTYHLGIKAQIDIAEYYCSELNYHNGGIARWGMMKEDIAYIQINGMLLLAYYEELIAGQWLLV